jgi:hypothetical protein
MDEQREIMKDLLHQCSEGEQMIFKRMYSHKNLELDIDTVVDNLPPSKFDIAMAQCERTVAKKNGI